MKHRLSWGRCLLQSRHGRHPSEISAVGFRVVITIHEAGKGSGATVREAWSPEAKAPADIARCCSQNGASVHRSLKEGVRPRHNRF